MSTQPIYVTYDFKKGLSTDSLATQSHEVPNLAQVTALATGLNAVKAAVRVVATSAVNLGVGGLLIIDGIQLIEDDRVLVTAQADNTENGIYLAKSGAWVRAEDADEAIELQPYTTVSVKEGGAHKGEKFFLEAVVAPTVGTDAQVWKLEGIGSLIATDVSVDNAPMAFVTSENVQGALEELDAKAASLGQEIMVDSDRFVGVIGVQGMTTPNFTGSLIPDGSNFLQAVQTLEDAVEASSGKYEASKYTSPIDLLVTSGAWTTVMHGLAEAFPSSVTVFDSANGFQNATHSFKWRPKAGDANSIEIYHELGTSLNVRVTVRK